MKPSFNVGVVNKIVFFIWYLSFLLLMGLVYFSRTGKISVNSNLPDVLMQFNLITGILFLILSTFLALVYLGKILKASKGKVLGAAVFVVYANTASQIQVFYNFLFYRLHNYPPDDHMTTSDGLFDALNKFRDG